MKNQELVDFLKENGVCNICQLRYLKARGTEYEDIEGTFKSLNVVTATTQRQGEEDNGIPDDSKKIRLSPCVCCLGLFSSEFQEELLAGILKTNISEYDCDRIVLAITLPLLLQIRQLSMWHALHKKFGNRIDPKRPTETALKEAIKLILNPIICKRLNKTYDSADGLMINITLKHNQEDEEVNRLHNLHDLVYSTKNGKRPKISRSLLEKDYFPSHVDSELFGKYLSVPPTIPNENLLLDSVTLTGPTVFVAGRYRKITRELSHTPWILNKERIMEDSIEEIIMRSIKSHFCRDESKVIFMSSGREDVDVRCLGKGRPFVLEIPDARRTSLTRAIAHEMENEIDKSLKISVRNLQMVERDELQHIKAGEEHKRKFYRALCRLEQPATVEILEKLNLPEGFTIQQKTPLRVLHRRSLHTRPRIIYSLKASVVRNNPKALVLDIVSQAGTYIKELIHGEFGRTLPSIASIINMPIDILALDVVAIDLDWPKDIDNSISE